MIGRRGPQGSLSPKFSVISAIISEVMAYCTNWRAPFFLIGRHLESVSRTELIFELNLAPSEERLICEFRSDLDNCYRVIVFRSQVATFVPGQSSSNVCARAKLKGHRS